MSSQPQALSTRSGDVHPLVAKNVVSRNWFEEWERTDDAKSLLGLIHCGLKDLREERAPDVSWANMIGHYLAVADGYRYWDYTVYAQKPPEPPSFWFAGRNVPAGELCRIIAHRAFEELCTQFFGKFTVGDSSAESSWYVGLQPAVIAATLRFFRAKTDNYPGIINLRSEQRDRHEITAYDFLVRYLSHLLATVTSLGPGASERFAAAAKAANEHLLGIVEILWGIRRLDLLLNNPLPRESEVFEHLEHLEYLVRREKNEVEIGNRRWPALTVKEAVFAGSQAAQVLVLLRIKQKERTRLEGIIAAKEQLAAAQERLHRLGSQPNQAGS